MPDAVLVLTTVPSMDVAEAIARALVEARLAACVNVLPAMVSVYRWKGEIQRETEHQLIIKTARARLPALEEQLAQLHPYDLPELLVLQVEDGDPAYLSWVLTEADPEGG